MTNGGGKYQVFLFQKTHIVSIVHTDLEYFPKSLSDKNINILCTLIFVIMFSQKLLQLETFQTLLIILFLVSFAKVSARVAKLVGENMLQEFEMLL